MHDMCCRSLAVEVAVHAVCYRHVAVHAVCYRHVATHAVCCCGVLQCMLCAAPHLNVKVSQPMLDACRPCQK